MFFRQKLGEDQKKRKKKVFAENWSVFFAEIGEDQKKKGLRRRLKCFFFWITIPAEFGAIFDRTFVGLFLLIIQRSNLDRRRLNLNGGTLSLNGGTLNLDVPPVPPTI